MSFMRLDRDNPRFDPSSMVVKVDGEEIEWMSISYGDSSEITLARAGGSPFVVGSGPGTYTPKGGSVKMHKDYASAYFQRLYDDAVTRGADRVSAIPHTVTVGFAEWNIASIVDSIIYVRFTGMDPGSEEGGGNGLAMVDCPFTFHRVKWNGKIQF